MTDPGKAVRLRRWIELARREMAVRAAGGDLTEACKAVDRGEIADPPDDGLAARLAAGSSNQIFSAERAEVARIGLKRRLAKR